MSLRPYIQSVEDELRDLDDNLGVISETECSKRLNKILDMVKHIQKCFVEDEKEDINEFNLGEKGEICVNYLLGLY